MATVQQASDREPQSLRHASTFPVRIDPEAQIPPRSRRPSGIKRATTTTTWRSYSFGGSRSDTSRPESGFSKESTLASPTFERPPLERKVTLDVEADALHGYPKLAWFLGNQQGHAIYRRFASLNARNLLYHQAKLTRLEHELNETEHQFAHERDLHYKIEHIFNAQPGSTGHKLHMKYEEVSRALDKWNKLLLEQRQCHALPSPDPASVETIYNYINSDKWPKPDWLEHPEDTIYSVYEDREPVQNDLVALDGELSKQDPFTRFFTHTFLDWWHGMYSMFAKPDGELGEYVYTGESMSRYISAIVMVVASALPTCSIVALYFIHSAIWRLVFIVLFSGLFSAALTFFTNATKPEIFMASATLAGVQVVFIGTAFGNGGNG